MAALVTIFVTLQMMDNVEAISIIPKVNIEITNTLPFLTKLVMMGFMLWLSVKLTAFVLKLIYFLIVRNGFASSFREEKVTTLIFMLAQEIHVESAIGQFRHQGHVSLSEKPTILFVIHIMRIGLGGRIPDLIRKWI
ncbi:hypothetical protein Lal_00039286 [Lupinus albus]|nr:hypothetical protein Lal_00039286 [Lupinus albus]